jgi:hypothetical protein
MSIVLNNPCMPNVYGRHLLNLDFSQEAARRREGGMRLVGAAPAPGARARGRAPPARSTTAPSPATVRPSAQANTARSS